MIEAHGGHLVDRMVDKDFVRRDLDPLPAITLDHRKFQDLINIANGRFSPLKGFMTHNDFLKVAYDMTLDDGTVWPLPVTLDVDEKKAAELTPDQPAKLCAPDGGISGIIEIKEIFKYNKQDIAKNIFGSDENGHPGVADFYDQSDFLVGGPIKMFGPERYNKHDLRPRESRVLFEHRDWKSVVGFQTRNAPHRAHEYIQKTALELVDGILVQPKIGNKKTGDYRDDIILSSYETLVDTYYPTNTVALSVFPSRMRYAGPREAVFDAIVRKNQGCTHFIIGRDHAGVGEYYDRFAAHHIFDKIDNLGIETLFFSFAFYCERCDGMASEKTCPHSSNEHIYPSGSKIREQIRNGQQPSEQMMRPEVAAFINEATQPFID